LGRSGQVDRAAFFIVDVSRRPGGLGRGPGLSCTRTPPDHPRPSSWLTGSRTD